jgi:hypothetical protein
MVVVFDYIFVRQNDNYQTLVGQHGVARDSIISSVPLCLFMSYSLSFFIFLSLPPPPPGPSPSLISQIRNSLLYLVQVWQLHIYIVEEEQKIRGFVVKIQTKTPAIFAQSWLDKDIYYIDSNY